jgi:homocysteine S-methyltransferase
MRANAFQKMLDQTACILSEGAVIERLRRNSDLQLDPHIVNSAFIYEDTGRRAIEAIYQQYLDIGKRHQLPLLLSTPTWRASRQRIQDAGYQDRDVNGDNYRFLNELRNSYADYGANVFICGLMSCRGDAYNPAESLSVDAALQFHAWQAKKLAASGVDFLMAATLPAINEAIGLARAMAATGSPYIVSFVLRPEGTLLDGTPIKQAIATIDTEANPAPLAYMSNCTHASIFRSAWQHRINSSDFARQRIIGLLANTAALKPEDLDNSAELVAEEPAMFGQSVANLHFELGLKILGGCCGTDDRHIGALASRIAPM